MNAALRLLRWFGIGATLKTRFKATTTHFRAFGRGVPALFILASLTLPATAQYRFTTSTNSDGTLTVALRQSCPEGDLTIPGTIDGRRVTSIGNSAFGGCTRLTSVTIPDSVTSIGGAAFGDCLALRAAYFEGNVPPAVDVSLFVGSFGSVSPMTVHYIPGTQGWTSTFAGRPTAPWVRPNPTILDFGDRFGPSLNGFGFVISWATNVPVLVEASADLSDLFWTLIATETLTDGWVQFTDPQWQQHPARFYRVRGQS